MSEQPVTITLESQLTPHPNIFLREEEDSFGLLFDPDTGGTWMLNETAVQTWKLLDGRRTLLEVVAILRATFEGMDAEAEKEVLQLAKELYGMGTLGLQDKESP